jgi:hypothetical protein
MEDASFSSILTRWAMRFLPDNVESRREFFRAGARYGLLGLLGVAAGLAARSESPASQRCVNRGICCGCGVFPICGLPPALSAKQAKGGAI